MDTCVWGRIGLAAAIVAAGMGMLLTWVAGSDPLRSGPVTHHPAFSEAELSRMASPPRPSPSGPALAFADLKPVALAGGVAARVLKVERHASGEAFVGRLHPDDRARLSDEDEPKHVVVVTVRFDDAQQPADEQDHLVRIDGRLAGHWRGDPQIAGESRAVFEAAAVVDADADRVSVELAAAVGPFTLSQRFAPGDAEGQANPGTEPAPVHVVSLIPRQRALVLEFEPRRPTPEPTPREPGNSWLFQAVCHDGRRVPATMRMNGSTTGHVVGFRVPSKDVERVEYRYRPYAWGAIGHVALPAATTQPAAIATVRPSREVARPGR